MRVDEEHRDGTAQRLVLHVQQKQALPGGGSALVIVEADEVEALFEADVGHLVDPDLSGARPVVDASEVFQECFYQADKAAAFTGTLAGRVKTQLLVALLIVVGRSGCAAVGCIRTRNTGRLH